MIEYCHDTVKSGDQIGTYRLVDGKVEMELVFKGKVYKEIFTVDNVGLLSSNTSSFLPYYAINGGSSKTYIHFGLKKVASAFADLWRW